MTRGTARLLVRLIGTVSIALTAINPAVAADPSETFCRAVGAGPDGKLVDLPGEVHVLTQVEGTGTFSVAAPDGFKVQFIQCGRSDIVPAEGDYKVLLAGFSLYIVVSDPQRIGALSAPGGHISFQLIKGPPLTDDEAKRIGELLDRMQLAAQAASGR